MYLHVFSAYGSFAQSLPCHAMNDNILGRLLGLFVARRIHWIHTLWLGHMCFPLNFLSETSYVHAPSHQINLLGVACQSLGFQHLSSVCCILRALWDLPGIYSHGLLFWFSHFRTQGLIASTWLEFHL